MSDAKYKLTVGLEVHAELRTKTKMFCDSKNDPDETRPNANVCPICTGHPGTLPAINKEAVKYVIKVGMAVGGKIADFTEFDRKNYFYPDIPKGYQISQYKYPLVSGGELHGVRLTRIHLEEDTGSSAHGSGSFLPFLKGEERILGAPQDSLSSTLGEPKSGQLQSGVPEGGGILKSSGSEALATSFKKGGIKETEIGERGEKWEYSFVDFNRAGLPLMELVTEPVIHSAKEAGDFGKEFQLLLRYLNVSEADMEKGQLRVEANISVAMSPSLLSRGGIEGGGVKDQLPSASADLGTSPRLRGGGEKLGTKVEVKNLNSFRAMERAIAYEYERQVAQLEAGERVIQETRGWDEAKQKTFSQRAKEDSHDYRYFPDPDLPKLRISEIPEFGEEILKKEMPELPDEKRKRYTEEYGIKSEDIEIFIADFSLQNLFEKSVVPKLGGDKKLIQLASNYITNDLVKIAGGKGEVLERIKDNFADLVKMAGAGEISSRGAKDILAEMALEGGDPRKIAEAKNLFQKSDPEALKKVVAEIISANLKVVADYKGGKEASLQYLVGQGMKATKGSANPEVLKKMLIEEIRRSH